MRRLPICWVTVRLLLDESMPRGIAALLPDDEVKTAQEMGWSGVLNGELLRSAAESGFDAFITVDKGYEFQQNLTKLPLTVCILRARSNRLEELEPLVPELLRRLKDVEPCSIFRVDA